MAGHGRDMEKASDSGICSLLRTLMRLSDDYARDDRAPAIAPWPREVCIRLGEPRKNALAERTNPDPVWLKAPIPTMGPASLMAVGERPGSRVMRPNGSRRKPWFNVKKALAIANK